MPSFLQSSYLVNSLKLTLINSNNININSFKYIDYVIPTANINLQICFYLDYIIAIRFNLASIHKIRSNYYNIWHNLNQNNLITKQEITNLATTSIYYPCINYLNQYFKGCRPALNLKLGLIDYQVTPFQFQVLQGLYNLVNLNTQNLSTYSELAQYISKEKAVRAAASAIANNPIPILIACHRILPKNSRLYHLYKTVQAIHNIQSIDIKHIGKYMSGANIKAYLLSLEFNLSTINMLNSY